MTQSLVNQVAAPVEPANTQTPPPIVNGASGSVPPIAEPAKEPVVAAPVVVPVVVPVAPAPTLGADGKPIVVEPQKEVVKEGAPEKYEGFKLPEGTVANAKVVEKFSSVAKELGLSQVAAQKLVDFNASAAKEESDAASAEYLKTTDGWKSDTIKVLGTGYQVELGYAARALDKFGTPGLRELLDTTGLGNHPEVVQMLVKAGKKISEDVLADGKSGEMGRKSYAELLYPKSK